MTKAGDHDENIDFWPILMKLAKIFTFWQTKNGIFGGKIFWSLFIV